MKTNITGFGQLTNSEIEAFEKQYSINLSYAEETVEVNLVN